MGNGEAEAARVMAGAGKGAAESAVRVGEDGAGAMWLDLTGEGKTWWRILLL